jgi:hypothetical protein
MRVLPAGGGRGDSRDHGPSLVRGRRRWAAGLKGLIEKEHRFVLTAHGTGTRLIQSETFGGLLVPLSGRVLRRAQASFRELNEAIGKQTEARPA